MYLPLQRFQVVQKSSEDDQKAILVLLSILTVVFSGFFIMALLVTCSLLIRQFKKSPKVSKKHQKYVVLSETDSFETNDEGCSTSRDVKSELILQVNQSKFKTNGRKNPNTKETEWSVIQEAPLTK